MACSCKFKTLTYFELKEFLYSEMALLKKIANLPTWEHICNIYALASLLDKIREEWGKAINVSSGFRGEELNKAVGGVSNSGHLTGFAADLISKDLDGLYKFMKNYLEENDIAFDELLFEESGDSRWIHFSLFSVDGKQRKKVLNISK